MRTPALLFGGDGQRRAWATRASVAGRQHVSRSPRPLTGATAAAMAEGSSAGIAQDRAGELERRFRFKHRADAVVAAAGYAFERTCGPQEGEAAWAARGL